MLTSPQTQCASGMVASSTVERRSAVIITRLRFQRSVSAPASRPKRRYGAASHAATSAVSDALSLAR